MYLIQQDSGRPKRERESKYGKERKTRAISGDKVKALVEKFEEQAKKEEDEKVSLNIKEYNEGSSISW